MILKQQRVIKHLLKKEHGERYCENNETTSQATSMGSSSDITQSEPIISLVPKMKITSGTRSDPELDGQNDSDSAIMLEDHGITEVL